MALSQIINIAPRGFQFFSANGTFTPSFTGTVYVTLTGMGVTGSSGATGASGRCHIKQPVAVTQGTPVTVTIGSTNGADSSFGALSTSTGVAAKGVPTGNLVTQSALPPFGQGGYNSVDGTAGACLVEW